MSATEGAAALRDHRGREVLSNGLDLDWVMAGVDTEGFIDDVHRVFGRVLGLDMYGRRGQRTPSQAAPCSPAATTSS